MTNFNIDEESHIESPAKKDLFQSSLGFQRIDMKNEVGDNTMPGT